MKTKNADQKGMTLDDLAAAMAEGFEKSNRSTDKKIEELATIVQDSLMELKDEIKNIKSDTEDIKADLNKKIDRYEHKELEIRVEKLEKKYA